MKTPFFVLLSLAISLIQQGAAAADSLEKYDRLCPSQGGVEEAILLDYKVAYHCDNIPYPFERPPTIDIDSPRDCAKLCKEEGQCKGSTWDYETQRCWLNRETEGPIFTAPGHIFMERQDACEAERQKIEELEGDIARCNTCLENKGVTNAVGSKNGCHVVEFILSKDYIKYTDGPNRVLKECTVGFVLKK
ncbi:hypothetical protein N7451_002270 [Penicillium sp. IBT 35674x]|nr:hypothetical protein N7451_002270 [Penicillium sp. IBT 35674x]